MARNKCVLNASGTSAESPPPSAASLCAATTSSNVAIRGSGTWSPPVCSARSSPTMQLLAVITSRARASTSSRCADENVASNACLRCGTRSRLCGWQCEWVALPSVGKPAVGHVWRVKAHCAPAGMQRWVTNVSVDRPWAVLNRVGLEVTQEPEKVGQLEQVKRLRVAR